MRTFTVILSILIAAGCSRPEERVMDPILALGDSEAREAFDFRFWLGRYLAGDPEFMLAAEICKPVSTNQYPGCAPVRQVMLLDSGEELDQLEQNLVTLLDSLEALAQDSREGMQ